MSEVGCQEFSSSQLWTGDYIHPGGPTRSSADSSVPRQRLVLRLGFP